MKGVANPFSGVIDYDLAVRAIEIADESMSELLQAHGVPVDGVEGRFGLVDVNAREVSTLAEADPAILDAFNWLRRRNLAEIVRDAHGEAIQLLQPRVLS